MKVNLTYCKHFELVLWNLLTPPPSSENYLMDGAALIQMLRPSTDVLANFEDYLQTYVIPYAVKKSAQYDVLHFVF